MLLWLAGLSIAFGMVELAGCALMLHMLVSSL